MSTLYEDTPLHIDASTNIRLLENIQADDEAAPIACTLRVIALQGSPKYTALSYVWGPPTPARKIIVNDEPFTVRENLWNFLHQARKDRRTCALWIDAICIDQDSNPERTHQVSMMGTIYSEAELVIAWLGTATKHSAQWERAMKTIPDFNEDNYGNFKRWYKVYGPCILELYNASYWSRIWIIQEFALARQLILQCGPHTTTGELLSSLHNTGDSYLSTNRIKKRPTFLKSLAMEVIDHRVGVFGHYRPLTSLVSFFASSARQRGCADRRDRVYALLAMCDAPELYGNTIAPDYSKSLVEVYAQLVRMVDKNMHFNDFYKSIQILLSLPAALMLEFDELKDLDQETWQILQQYRETYKAMT